MAKIIGPGSLVVDITGFAPHLPKEGETVPGSTVRFGPGGKGSNQLTAASRAGSDVLIISRRGQDFLGQIMKAHYDAEGMSEKYISIVEGEETGSALIEIDEANAQNRIIVILAANTRVTREDVLAAEADFADADAVLTQFETSLPAMEAAKELAIKYRKPFILNPAPYFPVPTSVFEGVDYVTPNETETEYMTGVPVNTVEGTGFTSGTKSVMQFKNRHASQGVNATVRRKLGSDINASCGQLRRSQMEK